MHIYRCSWDRLANNHMALSLILALTGITCCLANLLPCNLAPSSVEPVETIFDKQWQILIYNESTGAKLHALNSSSFKQHIWQLMSNDGCVDSSVDMILLNITHTPLSIPDGRESMVFCRSEQCDVDLAQLEFRHVFYHPLLTEQSRVNYFCKGAHLLNVTTPGGIIKVQWEKETTMHVITNKTMYARCGGVKYQLVMASTMAYATGGTHTASSSSSMLWSAIIITSGISVIIIAIATVYWKKSSLGATNRNTQKEKYSEVNHIGESCSCAS